MIDLVNNNIVARGRIQFDFNNEGLRYRNTIPRPRSEANLRRARERLESIKQKSAGESVLSELSPTDTPH